jgi:hypothetical protein
MVFESVSAPPSGGNVCFGVWKQLGNGNVKLHHIGLMFAPDGSVANVFTVDEINRVSHDGKTYVHQALLPRPIHSGYTIRTVRRVDEH